MSETTKPGKIYQALSSVMKEIGAIGKDNTNQQQGFKFRGIDQVYNAIHPLMAKYKVLSAPRVLEMMTRHDRQTRTGGVITFTLLKTEYEFISGEDGSSVVVGPIISEGMDSGDKGCAKALAVAHKYAIFQLFMIPTEEAVDGDFDSYQVAPMNQPLTPAQYNQKFQNGPQLPPQPQAGFRPDPLPTQPVTPPPMQQAPQPPMQRPPQPINPVHMGEAVDSSGNKEDLLIQDHEGAVFAADALISMVKMHTKDLRSLAEFWNLNKKPIDFLDTHYNDQYQRVKGEFTAARQALEGNKS